jgi:ubiquinone/menaquinone biosynthesis C-methylase UbiE
MRRVGGCLGLVVVSIATTVVGQQREPPTRLFSAEELGLLDAPDRDEWQQPDRVMDALNIADGSKVADLGAGRGWFTTRLARRVGPNGVVYAFDVRREMIESIRRQVKTDGLVNIQPTLYEPDTPGVPAGLHAVLVVDAYRQFRDPVSLLKRVAAALTPTGQVGIVDFTSDGAGGPGPPIEERVRPDEIVRAAGQAGLSLRSREGFLRYQFMLVFAKKVSPAVGRQNPAGR